MKIKFASSVLDGFHGDWVVLNEAFKQTLDDALRGGAGVHSWFTANYARADFTKYLAEQGPNAFHALQTTGYYAVQATYGGYTLEIRAGLDKKTRTAADDLDTAAETPVPVGGSIGIYLTGPTKREEITVRSIQVDALKVSEYAGAASVIAAAFKGGLSKYLSSLSDSEAADDVDVAITEAAETGSEEVAADIGLDAAIDALSIVEFVGIAVAIVALLTTIFFDLFKQITYQLAIYNETDQAIGFQFTYLYNSQPVRHHGNLLPEKNAVKSSLIPLGGGVTYDIAPRVTAFLKSANKADGLGYCITFYTAHGEPIFTLLGDIPSDGSNSFYMAEGMPGSEYFYNEITGGSNPFMPSRANKTLRLEQRFWTRNGSIEVVLANDQLDGKTHYAGVVGFNYNSILYLR